MAKVEDTWKNFEICMQGNCSTCPTYSGVTGEGIFCARGASISPTERRGCNCPECPLWSEYGLSGMYYCLKPKI